MPADPVLDRLRVLLSSFISVPEDELGPSSTPQNTDGWDSVANLWFLAAVEEEFKVTIGTHDAIHLRSLAAIAAYIGDGARTDGDGR